MGKRSKGPANEYLSDTARQRRQRQEEVRAARRAERQAKKKAKSRTIADQVKDYNMTETQQVFVTSASSYDELQEAWKALDRSDTLRAYVPKYKYDEAKQFAVGRRSFAITLPFELIRRIQRELSPHWRFGSIEKLNVIQRAALLKEEKVNT